MITKTQYNSFFPEQARAVLSILKKSGFECFFVGGCVRDFCMNRTAHDFDLTTNAPGETIISVMTNAGYSAMLIGGNCGTVGVKTKAGMLEITPYRTESGYIDHRHPSEIRFVKTLKEDLSRRDFTVNAMALTEQDGEPVLVDHYDGTGDIKKRMIRCVGKAETRIYEDALRILRAIRFAARLGFDIEEKTAEALFENRFLLEHISGERKHAELKELLEYDSPENIITKFLPILSEFLGDISASGLDSVPAEFTKRLFFLLRNQKYDTISKIIANLRLSSAEAREICDFKSIYDLLCHSAEYPEKELYSGICKYGYFFAEYLKIFGFYERYSHIFETPSLPKTINELDIDGNTVMSLGFKGKEIGAVLEKLLLLSLSGKVNNKKDDLLKYALRIRKEETI